MLLSLIEAPDNWDAAIAYLRKAACGNHVITKPN